MGKRKTHEEFVNEINNLVSDEYVVIGKYFGAKDKIEMKHNVCGYEWKLQPSSFLMGVRCPKCSGNRRDITTEIYRSEVFNLVGYEYRVLGSYTGRNKKILMIHNDCKNQYHVKPGNFLSGKRCPKCFGSNKLSTDEFKSRVYEAIKNEYLVIGEYVNAKCKIKMEHSVCGFVFQMPPTDFLHKGCRCPKCNGGVKDKNTEYFKKEVFDLVGLEYKVLGEYIGSASKILLRHNNCNNEYNVSPSSFLLGQRCPKCQHRSYKKTTDEYMVELYNKVGEEYDLCGDYIDSHHKVKIKHNICGNIYDVNPNNILRGHGCPKCKSSKGENKIMNYLETNSIVFSQEVSLPINKRSKFDFLVDGKIMLEYDGKQHFYKIEYFGGNRALKSAQKRDQIKNNYCIQNSIPLIRIPYWEYNNIEIILDHVLGYYNLIHKQDVDKDLVHKFLVNHPDWSHEKYIA